MGMGKQGETDKKFIFYKSWLYVIQNKSVKLNNIDILVL